MDDMIMGRTLEVLVRECWCESVGVVLLQLERRRNVGVNRTPKHLENTGNEDYR